MNATMTAGTITVTDNDRQRLGTLLQSQLALEMAERRQIDDLDSKLERAQPVSPHQAPPDVVTMNSVVRLRDLETDEAEVYQLVYPEQARIAERRISVLAPVGTAILGHAEGCIVEWPVPGGRCRLQIDEVIYQPERAGEFHL